MDIEETPNPAPSSATPSDVPGPSDAPSPGAPEPLQSDSISDDDADAVDAQLGALDDLGADSAFVAPEANFLDSDDDDDSAETPQSASIPPARNILDPIPALREISARVINMAGDNPENADEQTAVLLEDPAGFATQPAAISTWAYALALLFDGVRTAVEVAEAFKEKYGQRIAPEQAIVLQNELETAMFLNSSTFEEKVQQRMNQYLALPSWPAVHAGTAYPSDPVELMETIDSFFQGKDGPGVPAFPDLLPVSPEKIVPLVAEVNGQPIQSSPSGTKLVAVNTMRALIVPHIDLRVGGATYAYGYKELISSSQADLIFVLGVAHQCISEKTFNVSQKDFETPLGKLSTDREIAKRLHEASGAEDVLAELTHRGEHSIEFQAVLIRALLGKRCNREVKIVPILCGSIESYLARGANPFKDPDFIRFTDALRKELEVKGRKACVMCSVDLSHVGPEFGHNSMIDERLLVPLERMDRRMLKYIEKLDAEGFYKEILRTQNSRQVDAVMAVLTMFTACRWMLKEGHLLHYDQMMKAQTHSAVSYAAMSFSAA